MNPLPISNEYLNVDLDWEFDAGTSVCENDLDYLADSTALSMMIKSNVMEYFPYPIQADSDLPLIFTKETVAPLSHCQSSSDLPLIFTKETVAPLSHCQSSSDVHSVNIVSDTPSTTDQSYYSTSEISLESRDQALQKEKRRRPVKRTGKATVTTRRGSGWKKPKDAPKRCLSAYNYFFSKERHRVYAESGERAGFSRLGKIIGHRWKSLTDDQRRPYEIMAEKDIDRYREERKIYDDARRRKYGRSLYRSPSSVTTASTLSDDLQHPSPIRVSSALHPALDSVRRQHHFANHPPPPPTVYTPQAIMSDHHHNGQYLNVGGQCVGQMQQQQYAQQNPQVQYACVRMTREKAQEYMRR
jgi:hypothetical protein